MQRSKLALIAGVLGATGLMGVVIGAALAHFGIVAPLSGFLVFGLSLLLGLIAGVIALIAFYTTRAASNRSGRPLAWLGVVAAATAIGIVMLVGLYLFLTKSWHGRAIRAAAEDAQAAALVGITFTSVAALTFAIGIATTGTAGSIISTLYPFLPVST